MNKTLFVYLTLNEDSVVSGLEVKDTQLETVPENMKFVTQITANVPQEPSNSGTVLQTVNMDNRISHIVADYSRFIYTKKWNALTFMWEDYVLPNKQLTKFEFNSRFTFEELVAIQDASKTDSAVAVLLNKFNIAEVIDLEDPTIAFGLNMLVSKELLESERIAEILA